MDGMTVAETHQGGATNPGRHRRRGAGLEQAILAAAWEELQAVGYRDLSMDRVAARAGTSKPVLYRRWSNRAELVMAAWRNARPLLSGEVPDTGSLRGDVLQLLRRAYVGVAEIGVETIFGVLLELFEQPDVALFVFADQAGLTAMTSILDAAIQRGEIPNRRIPPRVATLPVDLARHELLVTRAPVPDAVLVQIVDQVFLPLVHARGPRRASTGGRS